MISLITKPKKNTRSKGHAKRENGRVGRGKEDFVWVGLGREGLGWRMNRKKEKEKGREWGRRKKQEQEGKGKREKEGGVRNFEVGDRRIISREVEVSKAICEKANNNTLGLNMLFYLWWYHQASLKLGLTKKNLIPNGPHVA